MEFTTLPSKQEMLPQMSEGFFVPMEFPNHSAESAESPVYVDDQAQDLANVGLQMASQDSDQSRYDSMMYDPMMMEHELLMVGLTISAQHDI